ncbi:class GN sortase [Shewanella dokdonensis]|uniref:Class GN sortase n=1 Tax=Shewanella dokdonensis TaxID=712036 RepID=A0ABX8DIZ5_9GAMM|nr:class GN sortase [Shewanella dokdonensis]MCL1074925.1 class GN sortase [Shewanella dokdonensis]QVK24700.1 class GN sortase [Shewanella dokdonensis]
MILLLLSGLILVAKGGYMQAKAMFAQYLIEEAWNKSLQDRQPHKPWFWADTHPVGKLWIGDNPPLYVLAGASGRNLAFGPAQMMSSAKPGELGNTVIAGHRDTHFAVLAYARRGQTVRLQTMDGATHFYRIRATRIVHQSQTQWLENSDESLLTLVTCYPFNALSGGAELRFLVEAEEIAPLQRSA